MAFAELSALSAQIGIPVWLLYIIVIWETVWTALAMWKSAKRDHLFWFIVFLLVNIFGIPEIIYLYVTSRRPTKQAPIKLPKITKKKRR